MGGLHVKFEVSPEDFLADLTGAVYQVALRYGFGVPFNEIELELQNVLREVTRKDMFVSDVCGLLPVCRQMRHFEPWSKKAEEAYRH